MSTLTAPYNIQNYAAVLAEGLEFGDRLHVRVAGGQASDQMFFVNLIEDRNEIVLAHGHIDGKKVHLMWGDIVELWLLSEKPNRFHSDVSEVAEVLARIKARIQALIQEDNVPGVRYLLGEIKSARLAETFFQEARRIIASVKT